MKALFSQVTHREFSCNTCLYIRNININRIKSLIMKLVKMYAVLMLLVSALIVSSCSDDDDYAPITLFYVDGSYTYTFDNERHDLYLTPYSDEKSLFIHGGDGIYAIEVRNKDIIKANYDGKVLTIEPVATGFAEIFVRDNSKNTYPLYISVQYPTSSYRGIENNVVIKGDGITLKEKEELEAEIRKEFLIEAGGQCMFVFKTPDRTQGEIQVNQSATSKTKKGTFKVEKMQNEDISYYQIVINISEKEFVYIYGYKDYDTRAIYYPPLSLFENVTDRYKEKYPALEEASIEHKMQYVYN